RNSRARPMRSPRSNGPSADSTRRAAPSSSAGTASASAPIVQPPPQRRDQVVLVAGDQRKNPQQVQPATHPQQRAQARAQLGVDRQNRQVAQRPLVQIDAVDL